MGAAVLRGPLPWGSLGAVTAYAIARLRVDVFVVEQSCPYPELDGRDLEPDTEHRWVEGAGPDGEVTSGAGAGPVLAYLRVLLDPGGVRRVGRVVTSPGARGAGLSGALLASVVEDHGHGVLVLDAQAHLTPWYARWGFEPSGPGFLEDGIPHVPMTRGPRPARGSASPGQASPASSSGSSVRRPV